MQNRLQQAEAYLWTFSHEIRSRLGVPLPPIRVKEKRFSDDTLADALPGLIRIDPRKDLSEVDSGISLESVILHELGHHALWALNEDGVDLVRARFSGSIPERRSIWTDLNTLARMTSSREVYLPKLINEGITETFLLNVFPYACSVSAEGRRGLQRRRVYHQQEISMFGRDPSRKIHSPYSVGYAFFKELAEMLGPQGFLGYVKDLDGKSIPLTRDFQRPRNYLSRYEPQVAA